MTRTSRPSSQRRALVRAMKAAPAGMVWNQRKRMKTYIVQEYRRDRCQMFYVCARPGYYRAANGEQIRDGSTGGPEHTWRLDHALEFDSHRAAARVAGLCPGSEVVEIQKSSMPPVLHAHHV